MISKEMLERLTQQLSREYSSHYIYLGMSSYCRSIGLDGFADWMRIQAEEELKHAMKFFDYIEHQQAKVKLLAIPEPSNEYGSVLDTFEKALAHERFITQSIGELCRFAQEDRDFASQAFLQWFATEQVEEEATAQTIVDKVRMIGESMSGLLYLDKEMGKRGRD